MARPAMRLAIRVDATVNFIFMLTPRWKKPALGRECDAGHIMGLYSIDAKPLQRSIFYGQGACNIEAIKLNDRVLCGVMAAKRERIR
jgi:hypothetical protein